MSNSRTVLFWSTWETSTGGDSNANCSIRNTKTISVVCIHFLCYLIRGGLIMIVSLELAGTPAAGLVLVSPAPRHPYTSSGGVVFVWRWRSIRVASPHLSLLRSSKGASGALAGSGGPVYSFLYILLKFILIPEGGNKGRGGCYQDLHVVLGS